MAERIPPKPGAGAPLAPPAPPAPKPKAPEPQRPSGRSIPGARTDPGGTAARARALGVGARGDRGRGGEAAEEPDVPRGPRARVGDPDVDRESFAALSPLLAAEHLTVVMAKRRGAVARADVLAAAGDLLLSSENADFVRRVLAILSEQTRVLDVYPLEVLAYCLERRPDLVNTHRFGPFVLNRAELARAVYAVEAPIPLALPLSATLKAMALIGGGSPGYHLYPGGGPTEYVLEMGAAGRYDVLLRAEVRRESVVDRVTVTVVDAEDDEPDRA